MSHPVCRFSINWKLERGVVQRNDGLHIPVVVNSGVEANPPEGVQIGFEIVVVHQCYY